MKLALQLASFGVLVFATVHTNSAPATIDRIINAFPAEEQPQVRGMLAEGLAGIVAQQLLKTADGKGRVAALEILVGNSAISALIREGKSFQIPSIMQGGQAQGMQTMDMALERMMNQKIVDPDVALEKASDRESFQKLVNRTKGDAYDGGRRRSAEQRDARIVLRAGAGGLRCSPPTDPRMPPSQRPKPDRPPSERPADDADWRSLLEGALGAVLEAADEGVLVFDRSGKCRMVGRRIADLFGIEPGSIVGKQRAAVLGALSRSCDDPESFLDEVGGEDVGAPAKVVGEIDIVRPRPRKIVWTSYPVIRHGGTWGRLGLVRDITRERAAERSTRQLQNRLEQLVPVDALTGLPNARRFREELDREHGRSSRAWDSYGVVRVDVDAMRTINDELGVPVGDVVLERVAECLNACRREYDLVARFDRDEFAAILPGADRVAVETVAARMVHAVGGHNFELADRRRVTACAGACVWVPPSGETGEDILRRAGDALTEAKKHGQGEVSVDST